MIKDLFKKQKTAIDYFYTYLDYAQCELVFKTVFVCTGVLFFTGVGKSGFIAQKIAATMRSTGTKAFFLSPIDARHGDMGVVTSQDLVIFLSKSGETEELLQLLPTFRNKSVKTICLTSNLESRLSKSVDLSLHLPCLQELCPFDLAPTTSSEIQLLFGDVLSIALMSAKHFSREAYAVNHPAGQIGKRASIKVRDLMVGREKAPLCFPEHSLKEALDDFSQKKCGCLIIVDREMRLKGIFTDGDLRRAIQAQGENILKEKIYNLMIPSPKCIHPEAYAWEALQLMESDQKHPITVLPVIEKEFVIGLIKMHDIVQAGI